LSAHELLDTSRKATPHFSFSSMYNSIPLLLLFSLTHSQTNLCPPGKTEVANTQTATSRCENCSPGRYTPTNSFICVECPAGYTQLLGGKSFCDIKSCVPTEVSHSDNSETGSITGNSFGKVQVTCDEGYSGGGELICQAENGTTAQYFTVATCTANTCTPTQIEHSDKSAINSIKGIKTGEVVSVSCKKGYQGTHLTTTCRTNGLMSPLSCDPIDNTVTGTGDSENLRGGGVVASSSNNINDNEVLSPSSEFELRTGSKWNSHWVFALGLALIIAGTLTVDGLIVYVFRMNKKRSHTRKLEMTASSASNSQRKKVQPKLSGWGGRRLTEHHDHKEYLEANEESRQIIEFNKSRSKTESAVRLQETCSLAS
jgi:hypothetical protein